MLKLATIVLLLLAIIGCTPSDTPDTQNTSVYEISGSTQERVLKATALLSKHHPPPTPLVDAYWIEEQIGDGVLGPSDFRSFAVLAVRPEDIPQWVKLLTPLTEKLLYNQPTNSYSWWVDQAHFTELQFFESGRLTGRANGWIGVSPQTGRIYIFTFTM